MAAEAKKKAEEEAKAAGGGGGGGSVGGDPGSMSVSGLFDIIASEWGKPRDKL